MEQDLEIGGGIIIPGSELWFTASRSGGPGGQHVNTTASKVTLCWDLSATAALDSDQIQKASEHLRNRINRDGVLQIHVSDERSQHQNRTVARQRLADLIRQAIRPEKTRVPTRPGKASKQKRLDDKKKRGEIKRLRKTPGEND